MVGADTQPRVASAVNVIMFPGEDFIPGDPPTPMPELLTDDELIRFLRLDMRPKSPEKTKDGFPRRHTNDNPAGTIGYFIASGQLKSITVGKVRRFRKADVLEFVRNKDTAAENR